MARFVAVLVLLAACGPDRPGDAADSDPAGDAARSGPAGDAAVAPLLAADRAFARATAERRLDAWVEAFAADGMQVSGAAVARGHAAIRSAMAAAFADPGYSLAWEPEGGRISDDGSLGYTWGRYEARRGGRPVGTGRYLTVWRRQPDGRWRVEADIGSPAPTQAGPGG